MSEFKVLVKVERCKPDTCYDCRFVNDDVKPPCCIIFDKVLEYRRGTKWSNGDFIRCPECLQAEKEHKGKGDD